MLLRSIFYRVQHFKETFMRRLFIFCLLFVVLFQPVLAQNPENKQLPVKRVVLYSHGVGYFERQGSVVGNQTIELPFSNNQMNDVLKSLLLLDLNGGRISTASYNAVESLDKRLENFSFNLSGTGSNSLTSLLTQLKGTSVEIRIGNETVTGKILGLEKRRQMQNQQIVETDVLVLSVTNGEIRSFDFPEIRGIRPTDNKLRKELERYLDILSSSYQKDGRTLLVEAQGQGQRQLIVGYTVEAPIWKTSYRISVDPKGQLLMQGWAIIDNDQNEDWENVELALISGLPVSFIQDLQTARYQKRPVIAYQTRQALELQSYEEAIDPNEARSMAQVEGGIEGGVAGGVAGGVVGGMIGGSYRSAPPPAPPAEPVARPLYSRSEALGESISASTTNRSISDLFEYKISYPVTIKRKNSAMIPIVNQKIDGERVNIFNEAASIDNPMSGIRLTNNTSLTLEGGPLTVFEEETYAGESIINRLKPGESKFFSYAADLGMSISIDDKSGDEKVYKVLIANGLLIRRQKQLDTKTYTIVNKDPKSKTVIIEHPARNEWKLIKPLKPFEVTANYLRFRVEVPAKSTIKFPVEEEYLSQIDYSLSNLTTDLLETFVSAKQINSATAASLKQILDLKQQLVELDNKRQAQDRERNEIFNDQTRLRENLKVLGKSEAEKELLTRYTKKLQEGEDRLESLKLEIIELQKQRDKLNKEINQMIRTLSYDIDL